jgi:bifunctional ADP-heptose synthase (sugar kinase/adenylyltransferase)
LANIAAGIAVEKHGTVAVGIDELAAHSESLSLLTGDARALATAAEVA